MNEEGLWMAAQDGDGAAFGALFDRYQTRVYRHALRLVLNKSDAEDLTATAFLELWRRRRAVRVVNGSILPWLLVTTTNAGSNISRSKRRYRKLLSSMERQPSPAEQVVYREKSEVEELMLRLKSIDRSLITLVILEGYTIAESAQVLDLTESAAKSRIYRAKNQLRHELSIRSGTGTTLGVV